MTKEKRGRCKFLQNFASIFRRKPRPPASPTSTQDTTNLPIDKSPQAASSSEATTPEGQDVAFIQKTDVAAAAVAVSASKIINDNGPLYRQPDHQRKLVTRAETDLDKVKRSTAVMDSQMARDKIKIKQAKRIPAKFQQKPGFDVIAESSDKSSEDMVTIHADEGSKLLVRVTEDDGHFGYAGTPDSSSGASLSDMRNESPAFEVEPELSGGTNDNNAKVALLPKQSENLLNRKVSERKNGREGVTVGKDSNMNEKSTKGKLDKIEKSAEKKIDALQDKADLYVSTDKMSIEGDAKDAKGKVSKGDELKFAVKPKVTTAQSFKFDNKSFGSKAADGKSRQRNNSEKSTPEGKMGLESSNGDNKLKETLSISDNKPKDTKRGSSHLEIKSKLGKAESFHVRSTSQALNVIGSSSIDRAIKNNKDEKVGKENRPAESKLDMNIGEENHPKRSESKFKKAKDVEKVKVVSFDKDAKTEPSAEGSLKKEKSDINSTKENIWKGLGNEAQSSSEGSTPNFVGQTSSLDKKNTEVTTSSFQEVDKKAAGRTSSNLPDRTSDIDKKKADGVTSNILGQADRKKNEVLKEAEKKAETKDLRNIWSDVPDDQEDHEEVDDKISYRLRTDKDRTREAEKARNLIDNQNTVYSDFSRQSIIFGDGNESLDIEDVAAKGKNKVENKAEDVKNVLAKGKNKVENKTSTEGQGSRLQQDLTVSSAFPKKEKTGDQQLQAEAERNKKPPAVVSTSSDEGRKTKENSAEKGAATDFNRAFNKVKKKTSSDAEADVKTTSNEQMSSVKTDGTNDTNVQSLLPGKGVSEGNNIKLKPGGNVAPKMFRSDGSNKELVGNQKVFSGQISDSSISLNSHQNPDKRPENTSAKVHVTGKPSDECKNSAENLAAETAGKTKAPPPAVAKRAKVQPKGADDGKGADVAWIGMARRLSKDCSDKMLQKVESKSEDDELGPGADDVLERGGTRASVREMVKKLQRKNQQTTS